MSRLTPLLRTLGLVRTPAADSSSKITALRASLDEARQSTQRWKARAGQLGARLDECEQRVAAGHGAAREAAARAQAWRHEIPSPAAVGSRFAHRLRTFEARTRLVSRADRESRLVDASEAYRSRLASGPTAADPRRHRMTLDGLHWWVPVRNPARGLHEKWVRKQRLPYHGIALTRELTIGGVMLDLGAHIGRMSIPRVVLGDVTAAYCAEPDPISYSCLTATVIDNGLRGAVLPDQTAIGDVDGTVNLIRLGQSAGFYVGADPPPGADVVSVPCSTLDRWVERLGVDLDAVTFVKVDVEGFELRLMRGAARVLACRQIAWQFEVNLVRLRGAGDDPRDLYAAFRQAFTHFIDLNRKVGGARVRPVAELDDALRYIDPDGKTDVLLYSA